MPRGSGIQSASSSTSTACFTSSGSSRPVQFVRYTEIVLRARIQSRKARREKSPSCRCLPAKLTENNVRKGFFERNDFVQQREKLQEELRQVTTLRSGPDAGRAKYWRSADLRSISSSRWCDRNPAKRRMTRAERFHSRANCWMCFASRSSCGIETGPLAHGCFSVAAIVLRASAAHGIKPADSAALLMRTESPSNFSTISAVPASEILSGLAFRNESQWRSAVTRRDQSSIATTL